jgi:hypothetical protein
MHSAPTTAARHLAVVTASRVAVNPPGPIDTATDRNCGGPAPILPHKR